MRTEPPVFDRGGYILIYRKRRIAEKCFIFFQIERKTKPADVFITDKRVITVSGIVGDAAKRFFFPQ